jgi:hypothetical protein
MAVLRRIERGEVDAPEGARLLERAACRRMRVRTWELSTGTPRLDTTFPVALLGVALRLFPSETVAKVDVEELRRQVREGILEGKILELVETSDNVRLEVILE